jgi:hypothetical protein
VHNGLVRTIAAWVKPNSSDDVSNYEAIVDSDDERSSSTNGSGIGLDAGMFKVRLDGVGLWTTNVSASIGSWQHVAVAFNGSNAIFYVNGVQRATRSYTANVNSLAGQNYRVGFTQTGSDVSTRSYFDGQIYNLQIFDRMLVPSVSFGQPIAANDSATMFVNSPATTINVLANDSHTSVVGEQRTVQSVGAAAHGTVLRLPDGGGVTYTPAHNYRGTDSFTYVLADLFGGTATATVLIKIRQPIGSWRDVESGSVPLSNPDGPTPLARTFSRQPTAAEIFGPPRDLLDDILS